MLRYSYSPPEDDFHRNSYSLSDDDDDRNHYNGANTPDGRHRSPAYRSGITSYSPGSASGHYIFGLQAPAHGPEQYNYIGNNLIPPADWSIHMHYDNPMYEPAYGHGRRNSITASEASTGALSDYIGPSDHINIDHRSGDELNHSSYLPAVGPGDSMDNFGLPTSFDIIPGPSSHIVSTHNRIVRENMYKSKQAHTTCMSIIDIMSKIRLTVSHLGIVEAVNPVDRDNVYAELEAFTAAAAPALQDWIRVGSQRRVGTSANIRVATARRSNRNGTQLFWCIWCGLVTTTKNNLGNHIRSHLGFHISFCESCPFSSVTSRIPDRHRASCGRRLSGH